jgi:hypothetical protein
MTCFSSEFRHSQSMLHSEDVSVRCARDLPLHISTCCIVFGESGGTTFTCTVLHVTLTTLSSVEDSCNQGGALLPRRDIFMPHVVTTATVRNQIQ